MKWKTNNKLWNAFEETDNGLFHPTNKEIVANKLKQHIYWSEISKIMAIS